MNDLSVTEAYFLCAVQNKGKIFGHDTAKIACLMSSVLCEMEQDGLITLSDKKITLVKAPSGCAPWLLPVYEHLKDLEALDYKHILQDYNSSWSDRHLNALTAVIGSTLADRGLVTRAKLGLFGGRTYFMPYKDAIPVTATELQVNIMYQTPVPDEDGFLWMLLEKSACIPRILPEHIQAEIHSRVTGTIHEMPDGNLARQNTFADKLLTIAKANTVFIN